MSTFISYLLSSGIILLVLYLIYKWLLARETFFHFNRAYLLASYGIAFLTFPIVGLVKGLLANKSATGTIDLESGLIFGGVAEDVADTPFMLPDWVIYAIAGTVVAGMAVMTVLTIIVAIHIVGTIRRGEHRKLDRYTLVLTENSRLAPFSWCGYIIMNRADYEIGREMILNHEMNHQRYFHWVDLIVAQLAIILQWFNPAAWLMREELRGVHEYEADMAVLSGGANAKEYQLLLIKKAVGAKFPALANCLNHSKLKKRITMMLKTKSSPWARMRAFVALPAIALAAVVINPQAVASALTTSDGDKVTEISSEQSKNDGPKIIVDGKEATEAELNAMDPNTIASMNINREKNTIEITTKSATSASEQQASTAASQQQSSSAASSRQQATPATAAENDKVYSMVEEMPQYPGGEVEMMKYIAKNLKYPEEAFKNNIQGRVVVQFVVKATGEVGDVKVIRSIDPQLDQAAIDVVKSLPAFTPGKVGGKPVAVWYTLPVNFRLSSEEGQGTKE